MSADKKRPHSLDETISAKVLLWEAGKLGISYRYPNDDRQIHAIGPDDWPVIQRLEHAGQLTFENEAARKRWGELPGLTSISRLGR